MDTSKTPRLSDVDPHESTASVAWWRGAAIAGIALVTALGGLVLLWLLARPLTLLLIAIVIAQVLAPLVGRLERWLPRGIAIVLVYLALVLIVGGVGALILPPLVSEGQSLVLNAPDLVAQSQEWLRGIDPDSASRVTDAV